MPCHIRADKTNTTGFLFARAIRGAGNSVIAVVGYSFDIRIEKNYIPRPA